MKNMTALFISIFLLTVGDAVCTAYEVKREWITEGNMLLHNEVMAYPVLSCTLVAATVGLILFGIWRVRRHIKWLPYALYGILFVKTGVIGLHLAAIIQATK